MKIDNSWFEIERVDDTTYAISEYGHDEHMHSYLLIGENRALLIDTGLGIQNIKDVVDTLTDRPITVVTTHVHWDHIGSHNAFKDICVHEADAEWLEDGLPIPIQAIRGQLTPEHFEPAPPTGFDPAQYTVFVGKPTICLKDGDVFDLGDRAIVVLHTPGHSPGHICLYEEDRGYLYTGDLVYLGTLFAFYTSTDPVLYRSSIHRVATLPHVTRILPAHHSLEVSLDILHRMVTAFDNIHDEGQLHHGGGIFDYGDFQIQI